MKEKLLLEMDLWIKPGWGWRPRWWRSRRRRRSCNAGGRWSRCTGRASRPSTFPEAKGCGTVPRCKSPENLDLVATMTFSVNIRMVLMIIGGQGQGHLEFDNGATSKFRTRNSQTLSLSLCLCFTCLSLSLQNLNDFSGNPRSKFSERCAFGNSATRRLDNHWGMFIAQSLTWMVLRLLRQFVKIEIETFLNLLMREKE